MNIKDRVAGLLLSVISLITLFVLHEGVGILFLILGFVFAFGVYPEPKEANNAVDTQKIIEKNRMELWKSYGVN